MATFETPEWLQPPPTPAPAVEFVDWSTFWTKDRTVDDWLIEGIIARGRGHMIFAKHKAGKSLLTLWATLEAINAGHVAIYLDYEMTEDDLVDRLEAMGVGPDTDLARLRYALIPGLPPLSTRDGGDALMAIVDQERERHPDREILVVVDTIGRAVEGDENASDATMDFYRHTGMPLKGRGVAWLRLDHEGKDSTRGARGSSAKGDDVDVAWQLVPTDTGIELRRYAARMGWVPEKVTLRKIETPHLTFERSAGAYPLGTIDTAAELDRLDIPVDASGSAATQALRDAGHARRRTVVLAAQKYRRWLADRAETGPETDRQSGSQISGTTSRGSDGNHAGNHAGKAHNQGQEPPPEPVGTSDTGQMGTRGVPYRGTPGPSPTRNHTDPTAASEAPRVEVVPAGAQLPTATEPTATRAWS